MRTFLTVTTTLLFAFIISVGCSSNSSPTTPDMSLPDEIESQADLSGVQGSQIPLWHYFVTIDPVSLDYTMEPVRFREASDIGDSFEVEISNYMTGWFNYIECQDCLRIEGIGLYGNGDILLDVYMRHPLGTNYRLTKRADLDIFDPRVILINNGTDARFSQTNGVGVTDDPIVGNFSFLKNADGYTSHFDNRSEIPEFIGTPRNYNGNLNPYKYFFYDNEPSPVIYGKELPEHRMRMSDNHDIQRFRLANPGGGNTIEFEMVVEVSYVQSAIRTTRMTPVYHLPEGNQKEAYRIQTTMPRTLVEGVPAPLAFNVYVEDWQNSTENGPLPSQLRRQSDVAGVTVEIPGVCSALGSVIFPSAGSGIMYNPYDFTFNMANDMAPTQVGSPYLALIAVEDEYNDFLRADVYYNDGPLSDFVAYRVLPITVIAPGTIPVITIYSHSVNASTGSCVISGEILYLDQTSVVTITHNGYTYPLAVDFDGSFTANVVLFVGLNNIQIDADNQFGADSEAIFPPIDYAPIPLPKFRVTLYWWPTVPDPLDSTDMDLHFWNTSDEHCYYDNRSITNGQLTIDDPDGYGPENIDGKGTLVNSSRYPVAVNYYSNHRGIISHSISFKVRFLLNPGTVDEFTEEWPAVGNYTLTEESFNSFISYPILDSTNSWMRIRDVWIDASGVASTIAPDITHGLPY